VGADDDDILFKPPTMIGGSLHYAVVPGRYIQVKWHPVISNHKRKRMPGEKQIKGTPPGDVSLVLGGWGISPPKCLEQGHYRYNILYFTKALSSTTSAKLWVVVARARGV